MMKHFLLETDVATVLVKSGLVTHSQTNSVNSENSARTRGLLPKISNFIVDEHFEVACFIEISLLASSVFFHLKVTIRINLVI